MRQDKINKMKLNSYRIYPIFHHGVQKVQESALEDIIGVLKVILQDKLQDAEIIENGIEILVVGGAMDKIINNSNMLSSCKIEVKGTIEQ